MSLAARFQAFTPEHGALVAGFLVVAVVLVLVGRRRGDDPSFRRGFAVVIPCFTVPLQVAQLLPGDFDLGTSLPLQYCDLAWVAATWALWTRHRYAVALTYFWGLVLTTQGIVTPSLAQTFPDLRYVGFWGLHFLTVWAALYLVSSGSRPTWSTYRFTLVVTALWAAFVIAFNAVTGTNYGYLNRKPSGASLLDLLPGWPAYVAVEVLVLVVVWALMTWPWERRSPGRPAVDPGS